MLLGILPSDIRNWHVPGASDPGGKFKKDMSINKQLAELYRGSRDVTFLDISGKFLKEDGSVNEDLFYDPQIVVINGKKAGPLHPNTKGQRLMAETIKPVLDKIMARSVR
jgi:lysophospholipase L1-like esterase